MQLKTVVDSCQPEYEQRDGTFIDALVNHAGEYAVREEVGRTATWSLFHNIFLGFFQT